MTGNVHPGVNVIKNTRARINSTAVLTRPRVYNIGHWLVQGVERNEATVHLPRQRGRRRQVARPDPAPLPGRAIVEPHPERRRGGGQLPGRGFESRLLPETPRFSPGLRQELGAR